MILITNILLQLGGLDIVLKNKIQYKLLKSIIIDTIFMIIAAILVQVVLYFIFHNISDNSFSKKYFDLSKILWNTSRELTIYYTDAIHILSFVVLLIPYSAMIILDVKKLVVNPLQEIITGLTKIDSNNLTSRLNAKTNYEFTDLKDTFNIVLDKLEQASNEKTKLEKQKDLLITGVSHDLKTPITTIRGYSQALNEDMIQDENQKREYLKAINKKSIQLNNLISLLFEYVTLSSSKNILTLEDIDLIELMRENLALFYTDFEEREIHFKFEIPEEPLLIKGDKKQLNRVFANIYSNALKHNHKGDTVNTRLDLTDGITIYIEDTGDSIPQDIVYNVFEPFVTGDTSRKTGSGTGLGLSIASKIIELHNGSISLIQDSKSEYTKSFVIKL